VNVARKLWPLAVLISISCFATTKNQPNHYLPPKPLISFSHPVITLDSRFSLLEEARCSAFLPPQLLAGRGTDPAKPIVIDFIVGRNGAVEKPVILESADPAVNVNVLDVISGWRYRPALCDGLPIETEGRIELGSPNRN
jgi:hypothetical protein